MEWPLILALALLVPCVLMPAFFIWYLNKGGGVISIKFARARPALPGNDRPAAAETEQTEASEYEQILLEELKRHLQDNPPVPD